VKRSLIAFGVLVLLGCGHIWTLNVTAQARLALPVPQAQGYVLPGPLLKVVAGEHSGLVADFCFLQGLVAYGRTLEGSPPDLSKELEWQRIYRLLDAATDLDPYFLDPYYFGNAVLSRNPDMVPQINELLEKGVVARDWDWMLPFYLGFNYYYYLNNNDQAAEYLMLGANRPGAMPLLTTLAARLAYKGNRTENAIGFLRGILSKTEDEKTRELYQTRLEALEKIFYLERAVAFYTERFGIQPGDLQTLVKRGVIPEIPADPYGGSFFIADDGSIQSTSDLAYGKGNK